MSKKNRIILDIIMLVLLIFCMKYQLTGGIIHEIIGMLMILGMIVHLSINFMYYPKMIKAFSNDSVKKKRAKQAFALNLILFACLAAMLISSFVISKDLFYKINGFFGHYEFWRILHIICAVLLLICCVAHLLLHDYVFKGIWQKRSNAETFERTWKLASRSTALIMVVLVVYLSVRQSYSLAESIAAEATYQNVTDQPIANSSGQSTITGPEPENDEDKSQVALPETETTPTLEDDEDKSQIDLQETETTPTLDQYLSGLFCTGCHKHCPLISPRCGRGEQQASEAEIEYNNTYNA